MAPPGISHADGAVEVPHEFRTESTPITQEVLRERRRRRRSESHCCARRRGERSTGRSAKYHIHSLARFGQVPSALRICGANAESATSGGGRCAVPPRIQ